MRIPSGVTDQVIYFVAVDATDLKTREINVTGWGVYRSRNGGTAAAMTSPTVTQVDSTNMPGVYTLLLNEDMTIDAGDDEQEMVFHITATGIAPVTRSITVFRPKITLGNTLDVTATGAAGIDWGNVENQSTSVNLSATTSNLVNTATTVTNGVTVTTNNDKTGYSISGTKTTLDALNDPTVAAIADGVWDELVTGHNTAGSFAQGFRRVVEGLISVEGQVNDVAATTTTFVTDLTEATDNHYNDLTLMFIGGALAGQAKPILSYNGTTKAVTLSEALTEAPGNGIGFIILSTHVHPVSRIADGVWDEATVGHTTAGTFGEQLKTDVDAILADTAELQTDWVDGGRLDLILDARASQTSVDTVDTVVDAIKAKTDNLTFTVTNQVDANMLSVSSDGPAADNLEAQYDGTGLTGGSYPARQDQVDGLAIGSASISVQASTYQLTTGTQTSGTYTSTFTRDGVAHQHTDLGGTLNLYYEFAIGGNGVATEASVYAALIGSNDTLGVYAYNWAGSSWDQVGELVGGSSVTYTERKYSLLTRHTGTGANLGKVQLRFFSNTLTTATLYVDQISMGYAVITNSVGYDQGSIWVDTISGTAGTEAYVNGVADNPVLTYADALTLASTVGLRRFHIINGSAITLTGNSDNYVFDGHEYSVALNGQSIAATMFIDADVTGTSTGADAEFQDGIIGTATLAAFQAYNTSFTGTVTLLSAGDYRLVNCQSGIAGTGAPTFTKTPGQTITMELRRWSGGVTISGIESGDVLTVGGEMGTITLNGANGTVEVRGSYKAIVDNRTGSPTLGLAGAFKAADIATILADTNELQSDWVDGGRLDTILDARASQATVNAIEADTQDIQTQIGTAGAGLTNLGGMSTGMKAEVNAEIVDVLATDTYGEPGQGAPGATISLADKINYLYKAWRNKSTMSTTQYSLFNDAGSVVDQKAPVSDSGTLATRDEIASGP